MLRRSDVFAPTMPLAPKDAGIKSHEWLLRAGFVRKTGHGLYAALPLATRSLAKIEAIIDDELGRAGAQKLQMPLLLDAALWRKTGRWESTGPELFRLADRRGVDHCLAPTAEEPFTDLVAGALASYRDLPVRLYQTARKYRDEVRPRFGLMRAREFTMCDLYTFDRSADEARATYAAVRACYARIFTRAGLPFVCADADTGNIGGSHSHEYHIVADAGEDALLVCPACSYAANVEKATAQRAHAQADSNAPLAVTPFRGAAGAVVHAVAGQAVLINAAKLTALARVGALQPAGAPRPTERAALASLAGRVVVDSAVAAAAPPGAAHGDLHTAQAGDACAACAASAALQARRGIEVGHAFLLGTLYSRALGATFRDPAQPASPTPVEMGCFGIGVSRLLAAAAERTCDADGLRWPLPLAPYAAIVVAPPASSSDAATAAATRAVYDELAALRPGDVLLDERESALGARVREATMQGFPLVVTLGRAWREAGSVDVAVRRTGERHVVAPHAVAAVARDAFAAEERVYAQ